MVWQESSFSRFQDFLTSERSIAGNGAMILRIIACFQPLEDCQVTTEKSNLVRVLGLRFSKEKESCINVF